MANPISSFLDRAMKPAPPSTCEKIAWKGFPGARLDAIGFSPAVTQSNNDFGVASTFSVNAHGWPVPFSGCGSTVHAITMVLADGNLVTCSRTENADLFRHAMGGYGQCLVGLLFF